jgi:hypothetical protein
MEVDLTPIEVMTSLESPIPEVVVKDTIKVGITGQGWTFLLLVSPLPVFRWLNRRRAPYSQMILD